MSSKNSIEKSKNPSKKTCPNCNNVLRFSCINMKSNDKLNDVETSQDNEENIKPESSKLITDWQMVKDKTEMSKIFRKIAQKDLTKQGLEELHNFR